MQLISGASWRQLTSGIPNIPDVTMIGPLRRWIERRQSIRRRWQKDARSLAAADPIGAYYEAQRLAARHRARGDTGEYWH